MASPAKELDEAKKSYAANWDSDWPTTTSSPAADPGAVRRPQLRSLEKINDKIQTAHRGRALAVAKKFIQPAKMTRVKAGDLAPKDAKDGKDAKDAKDGKDAKDAKPAKAPAANQTPTPNPPAAPKPAS